MLAMLFAVISCDKAAAASPDNGALKEVVIIIIIVMLRKNCKGRTIFFI